MKSILRRCVNQPQPPTYAGETRFIGYTIWCPGCECRHFIRVNHPSGYNWTFNGNEEKPTFTPSLLVQTGHYADNKHPCWCDYAREHPEEKDVPKCSVCHSFITNGSIQFLSDCTHKLAGQTVPLQPH